MNEGATQHRSSDETLDQSRFKPLRIWPPIFLLVAMLVTRWIPTLVEDGPPNIWMFSAFGPVLCGLLVLLWWIALSRATWLERLVGFFGVIVAFIATVVLVDATMRGPAITVVTLPMGLAAFAIGASLFGRVLSFKRTVIAILFATCGFGFSTLLRTDGFWGNFAIGLHWRWQPSAEQQLLAQRKAQPSQFVADFSQEEFESWLENPEWPGFRGADRSSRQHGSKISSDWSVNAPKQLWKIPVGPGWSSFAVAGNLLFTQEQRGEMETVVCYMADTGDELWTKQIQSRFDDPLGGPGPRATPTLAGNALFVMGASGQLMRLDPRTGEAVWEQDLRKIADRQPPMWGFCSSPLVVDSNVVVHAGGSGDRGILAFDIETGNLVWSAASGDHTYSSPQLGTIAGGETEEEFILMLTNMGINLLDPHTGAERLSYQWKHEGYRSLQPQIVDGNSILLPTGMGTGTRRIRVVKNQDGWSAAEQWTSRSLKPDFNDFVVFQNHAYGFDGAIFTCIDLETGERNWRGGRYGKGQVLLLEDSALLLVLSETGEVILLKADPAAHTELTQFNALQGKTWNHPVVVGDQLYVRNSQEAACFQLP